MPLLQIALRDGVGANNSVGESTIKFSSPGWKNVSTPINFEATDGIFKDKIRLSWSAVDGATSYTIYKGVPLVQYQTGVVGVTFDDTVSLEFGTVYTYGVKAVGDLGESGTIQDTGFIGQDAPESAPTGLSASDGAFTDKITISWNPVSTIQGVSGYKLFRNEEFINDLIGTTFEDTTIQPGITHEYKVKAYNLAGDGITSSGNTGWIALLPPSVVSASTNQPDRVDINWSTVSGATAYKVFSGSPLTLIGTTTGLAFADFTPTFGGDIS